MVQSTNCIIILVPIPSLPKPPFLTMLISCKHSCRFSPPQNTGYPIRKLTIHFGNHPPIKRQGKLPLTQHNITLLLYKTQLSKHPQFWAKFEGKKVRLIRRCLRYFYRYNKSYGFTHTHTHTKGIMYTIITILGRKGERRSHHVMHCLTQFNSVRW